MVAQMTGTLVWIDPPFLHATLESCSMHASLEILIK